MVKSDQPPVILAVKTYVMLDEIIKRVFRVALSIGTGLILDPPGHDFKKPFMLL
jgi:hypothetical protein